MVRDIRSRILERARRLAEFPGQKLPPPTPTVLAAARRIARGEILFYKRDWVRVGTSRIDWSGGHLRHQEWPAQLNRFFYLAALASAWRKTRDERFAAAARGYIEDWMSRGNYEDLRAPLRPGDNTLNMSIRLGESMHGGWGGTLPAFLDSAAFDDAFLARVLASLESQAVYLSRHLNPRGNWRIAHLDALVFTALRFPFMKSAKRLLSAGIRGMRAGLATQFLPDGVHVERTPGYHGWMARVAWNYLRVATLRRPEPAERAKLFPAADAHVDAKLLARAFDYHVQSELSGFNDANVAIDEPKSAPEINGLTGRRPPLAQVFPDAGQVFVRSSWKPALSTGTGRRDGADYLAFDASTWGGGHAHLSRLAFTWRSGGRLLVADPGILSYEMSDPSAIYGKSTPAHSTLNLDGLSQSECDAKLLAARFTKDASLLHAKYEGGYWPGRYGWQWNEGRGAGVFGAHERVIFQVKGEYLLVLDRMECDPGREIRSVFQLGPMDGWRLDAKRLSWRSTNRGTNLAVMLAAAPADARVRGWEGSRRPIRGWLGGGTGLKSSTPAPLVEFRYPAGTHRAGTVSAALLVPFRGARPPATRVLAHKTHAGGWTDSLELALPGGRRDFIAWSWHLELPVEIDGRVQTSSPFVWIRTDANGRRGRSFEI